MNETSDITLIKGIGEKTAKLFSKLSVNTVDDLLEYYPKDYEEYKKVVPIAYKKAGCLLTFQGFIYARPVVKNAKGRTIIIVNIKDETGSITLTWFNTPYILKDLKVGTNIIVRGKVTLSNGRLSMVQPEILTVEKYLERVGKIFPIYGLVKGLSNNLITKSVKQALEFQTVDKDFLPPDIKRRYDLMERKQAVVKVHFPKDKQEMIAARRRLVFDEFFIFSLAIRKLKLDKGMRRCPYKLTKDSKMNSVLDSLSFRLTNSQLRTLNEIVNDMKNNVAMNRLVQGDVGSGKTIIAALAMVFAVENGYQAALLVPTQVLASQHYESLVNLLETFDIRLGLLTSMTKAKEKREIFAKTKNGEIDILIGTHAILEDNVEFKKLALIITDEQHRFGVVQRESFANKGENPHVLVLSATPIPRTLAIIMYGDLDISIINELPNDRLPIKNAVVDDSFRPKAYSFIKEQIDIGHQAYIVCPMVEPNEELDIENVMEYEDKLKDVYGDTISYEILHGKMKPSKKDEIMERFAKGEIQLLISTTVVEVGINVPNATVMMIENSERFGLASLHQLRGRVGRGKSQSYCIFMMGNDSEQAKERLDILSKSNDGFEISRKDLEIRGPGELFGLAQSGDITFDIGDIYADSATLMEATELAKQIDDNTLNKLLTNDYFNVKMEKIAGNVVL